MGKKEKAIFDGQDNADGGDVEIRINEKFAQKYHERKRHEELQNLKNVDLSDDDDESDSETEDEDGDHLTAELDKDISQTLKLIRKKDPSIYDSKITFFEAKDDDDDDESARKTKKTKPLYYKDLVRQQVLAGDIGDSDDDDDDSATAAPSYAEEQAKLKGDFFKSLADGDGDDEDELDGGLFSKRTKTAEEADAEQKAFDEFKEVHGHEMDNADAFLEKYLKSGAWKEKRQLPRYDEIVGNAVDDDEDEEELDKADAFEHAYNFRFEEEGGGQIQTFSRHIDDSLRRKDDKRKVAREERKARKALERQKKEEELRRLKNLKSAEIQAKLDKVTALMGDGSKLTAADIDGEFDPAEHDRRMAEVFDDEYYGEEDGAKPTWDDDDDVFGKLPVEDEEEEENEGGDEEEADVDDGDDEALAEGDDDDGDDDDGDDKVVGADDDGKPLTKAEIEAKKKKYLDELYSLDYEDLIGDLPCRFKYREVAKNAYGLTTHDILHADDQELKSVVSLKRLAPFADREYAVNRKKVQQLHKTLREKEEAKKRKKAKKTGDDDDADDKTDAQEENAEPEGEDTSSKKKRKRRGKKDNSVVDVAVAAPVDEAADDNEDAAEADAKKPAKKKRKHKKSKSAAASATPTAGLSASRLESYRLKPLKK
ncbi:Aste57867_15569 [Aphanomyces stellatus]|uniref:Aste57867_15569 protein n=1 Tax=Aphanomyces stellatus TaxID=120398 RepID=A0A485L3F6_9STRA|nr:hypothetical protein As57867_015513 [Aphanomyces stellatus]VFT92371.1 Aste57867_15569 [Aphanomyces stellatus]